MIKDTSKRKDEKVSRNSLTQLSKSRIRKNIFVLCLVFFMTFTAYDCLSMLQSTLNHKHGIGVICQATVYGCYCISSLLLPKYVIKKLGCKLTLVLSMTLYLPYIASNLYPHWSFMVPTAVFNGLSASLLWGAQSQYVNESAIKYVAQNQDGKNKKKRQENNSKNHDMKAVTDTVTSHPEIKFVVTDCSDDKNIPNGTPLIEALQNSENGIQKEVFSPIDVKHDNSSNQPSNETDQKSFDEVASQKDVESMTARLFGLFGLAYLSTHMVSNVMSYFILQTTSKIHLNATLNSSCACGADFCNEENDCFTHNLQAPGLENRYLLIGICLALGLVSILIMTLFLDSLEDRNPDTTFSLDFLLATGKQLKNKNQILLTPISFYIGMMQGFYSGDFNLSFVGCAWGTSHVALVSACYGAACSVSSPVSGWLVKLIGRLPIISFALLVNIVAEISLLHWTPSAESPAMFFVLAALWGTTLGIMFSQVKAMYGFLFEKNQEAAFGAYHVWYSLGFCLSFAYSSQLCTYIKIYALLSVLILGFVMYLYLEMLLRLQIKKTIK